MSGEKKVFKRRLFGGFDRRDVMEYINKLASERNTYKARSNLGTEQAPLGEDIEVLRRELSAVDTRLRELGGSIITDAGRGVASIEDAYDSVRSDALSVADNIRRELTRLSSALSAMSSAIVLTGARLEDMRKSVSDGTYTAAPPDTARIRPIPPPDPFTNLNENFGQKA